MRRSELHTVVITVEDGERRYEVTHHAACPQVYICGVQHELDHVGAEALVDGEGEPLPPGTYTVRSWHTGPDHVGEYDGGLDLVDAVEVARLYGDSAEVARLRALLAEAVDRLMVSEGDARYMDANVELALRIDPTAGRP